MGARRHRAAVAVVAAFVLASCGSDDGNGTATTAAPPTTVAPTTVTPSTEPPPTTTPATTTPATTTPATTTPATTTPATTTPATTTPPTTTTTVPSVDRSMALWPFGGTAERYDDPLAAATSFATDYLGFTDPVVGEFRQGDNRSGEVEIRPIVTGPATTVLLRQLGGEETWSVLGAVTENIDVTAPAPLDTIQSPVTVTGSAFEFEGHVAVEVREDDNLLPIGEGYVTGGGSEMLPFEGTIVFDPPTRRFGAVLFRSFSAKDGSVWDAAVVRVRFTGGEFGPHECAGYEPGRPPLSVDEVEVTVWFHCDPEGNAEGDVIPVFRPARRGEDPITLSVRALLAGPTEAEIAAGITSWFSQDTADALRSVEVTEGNVVVDFVDLRTVIPNASSSAGSVLLLRELDSTVLQFPDVASVEYRIEGSCTDFTEWLQIGGCEPRTRPVDGAA